MSGTAGVEWGTPTARGIVAAATLGSGLTLLDGTVVNVALRTMGDDLGAFLVDPAVPAPLEHADTVVPVIVERPPKAGRILAAGVIDGDDVGLVADPPDCHRLGESLRLRHLGRDRIVEVDDVARPVDVHRAGDVGREVFVARPR